MNCLNLPRLRHRHGSSLLAAITLLVLASTVRADGLGASYDAAGGVTFSVHSATATRVEVWIYALPQGDPEKLALPMINNPATHVWSLLVSAADLKSAGVTGTVFYGYRAWGPNWPFVTTWKKGSADGFIADVDDQGNRFNPNKLLLDPYAREVSHDPRNPAQPDGSIYLSGPAHRTTDTGDKGPKGLVLKPDTTSFGTKPARTLKDEIIYEVHLRGLTKIDPIDSRRGSRHLRRRSPQAGRPQSPGHHRRRVPPHLRVPERCQWHCARIGCER